jgi:hypothetical protein
VSSPFSTGKLSGQSRVVNRTLSDRRYRRSLGMLAGKRALRKTQRFGNKAPASG